MTTRNIWLAAACATLLLSGCSEEPQPVAEGPRPIKTITIEDLRGAEVIEYPGVVSTARTIELGFEVQGRIIEIPVIEGQEVEEGALLAALDPRDYQSRLDQEVAKVALSEAEFERAKKLFDAKVSSKQEFERKKRIYEVAVASLSELQKALDDTRLLAPFDGVVAKRMFREFKNVQAKEPVFVFQDDDLELIVSIPEGDFSRMTPGLTLEQRRAASNPTVILSSLPDRRIPATIKEFATTADPVTRTFPATFAFETPTDAVVNAGMTAHVRIEVPAQGASAGARIPVQAVRTDDTNQPFVWIVDPATQTVVKREVTLGELSDSDAIVTGGLERGNTIAVSGVQQLREGMSVRPIQR